MVIVDMFVVLVGGYVVYRQETIEKTQKEILKEQALIKRSIPKRWSDKIFDRESD